MNLENVQLVIKIYVVLNFKADLWGRTRDIEWILHFVLINFVTKRAIAQSRTIHAFRFFIFTRVNGK